VPSVPVRPQSKSSYVVDCGSGAVGKNFHTVFGVIAHLYLFWSIAQW
jgi:hypothetical protein